MRRPSRLVQIAGIGVDRMGALADASGRDLLRLENLDSDIPPDPVAVEQTHHSVGLDENNSYLPFVGQTRLREVAARHVSTVSGLSYTADNCVISAGGLSGILNVLLATVEVDDEVIVTDPTYAGLINRIRLAGGVPRFVPFDFDPGRPWSLDREVLARLLEQGVCATAMAGWGSRHGARFIRLVFANEPVPRLELLGDRVRAALVST